MFSWKAMIQSNSSIYLDDLCATSLEKLYHVPQYQKPFQKQVWGWLPLFLVTNIDVYVQSNTL